MFCIRAVFDPSRVSFINFKQPTEGNVLVSVLPVKSQRDATSFDSRERAESALNASRALFAANGKEPPNMDVVEN